MLRTGRTLLFLFSAISGFAQSGSTLPSFDVAEVKINKSGAQEMYVDFRSGQVTVRNVPLRLLITAAYHIPDSSLEGAPGWLAVDRYDVIAKAAPTTPEDQLRLMVRTLLADRLKLATHEEQKPTAVYAMVVSKRGLKMQPSETAKIAEDRCRPGQGTPGDQHVVCQHMTMRDLADAIPNMAPGYIHGVPVVDQTDMKGSFEFKLDWTPAGRLNASIAGADGSTGTSFFDAVEAQLGLRLENRKVPMPVIVIDHVERVPVEN